MGDRHHRTPYPGRQIYCCVVLDAFSRRVAGWSIDSAPAASLVSNALGMAIDQRNRSPVRL